MTSTRVAAGAVATAILFSGCATPAGLRVTGRVDVGTVVVAAPALAALVPDPQAGFTPTPAAAAPAGQPATVPAVRVTDVVGLGDRVSRGDAIAHVDAAVVEAALAAARADATLARRREELLASRRADVADRRDGLREKRRDLVDALATMANGRRTLLANRSDLLARRRQVTATTAELAAKRAEVARGVDALTAARREVKATIEGLQAQREALAATPDSPAKVAALAQLDAGLAAARDALAQLGARRDEARTGLAQLEAGLSRVRSGGRALATGLTKLTRGLATLDANRTRARDGVRTLDEGLAQLADAAAELADAAELAQVTSRSAAVAVRRAEQQRDLTTLVAPVDGVVVGAATAGDVVAPGAPLVTIRAAEPATVTVWVDPDAAASLCLGDAARVDTDWGATYSAAVSRVGVRAEYPPTAQATDEVHLTRAVAVTVALTGAESPPPGAPVDLTITACPEET